LLFCLLVEVGNGDTGSQDSVVRVCDGHVGRSLGSLKFCRQWLSNRGTKH
jgi:hypothetical protein